MISVRLQKDFAYSPNMAYLQRPYSFSQDLLSGVNAFIQQVFHLIISPSNLIRLVEITTLFYQNNTVQTQQLRL